MSVHRVETAGAPVAREEKRQAGDAIGEIQGSVFVGVAAPELSAGHNGD